MKLSYLMPLTVETVRTARRLGYDGIEAGARWLDGNGLADLEANLPAIREAMAENRIVVTSLAIYGDANSTPVADAVAYYARAVGVAAALGCKVVSGMTGRDNRLTVDENITLFTERFGPIAEHAADHGVRIAFEPWPGGIQGYGDYRWTNLAVSPVMWDRLFEAVPNPALGLEYDPSHLVWQGIDYLQAIRDYGERIYHMHAKDIIMDRELLKRAGVHGKGWWRFVLPGLGELDWQAIFDALKSVGYAGDVAVEHEDREYMGDKWNEGLSIALKTLRPLVDAY